MILGFGIQIADWILDWLKGKNECTQDKGFQTH